MFHTYYHRSQSFFSRFRVSLSVCGLLCAFLLSACSLGGGSTGTSSSTTSGNTPAHLTAYTGDGFSIGSPAGWSIQKASSSAASVIFIDPTSTMEFTVTVTPNPNGNSATSVALDPRLHSMQSKPHYQQVDLAPTKTVGGETWGQIGAIGDLPYSGQPLSIKVIALATNRPVHDANTKMYIIQYNAPAAAFDQVDSTVFQPMLQSFKFTSGATGGIIPTQTSQGTTPINATVTYASVKITIVDVQQASSFADDTSTSADKPGALRVNFKEENSTADTYYNYSGVLLLIMPDNTTLEPLNEKETQGPNASISRKNWVDFAVPLTVNATQLTLHFGTATETPIDILLTPNSDVSKYQARTATPNKQVQQTNGSWTTNWTITSVSSQLSDNGKQADKGMVYVVVSLKISNPSKETAYYGGNDNIRLKAGDATSAPSKCTIPGAIDASTTNVTGTCSFLVPGGNTSFTFVLVANGTVQEATIPFQIP